MQREKVSDSGDTSASNGRIRGSSIVQGRQVRKGGRKLSRSGRRGKTGVGILVMKMRKGENTRHVLAQLIVTMLWSIPL